MAIKDFKLEGKTALITGGGTGIGFGIAATFLEAGAKVVISGRRETVLQEAVEKLGKGASYVVNDINQLDSIPAFVAQVEAKAGNIDILVNNAGKNLKVNTLDTTDEDFLSIINTNILGVFSLSREVAKRMKANGNGGSIIMISSMAAVMGIDRVVAYATAKTGLIGMMRTMVADLADFGIRVNAIAPGWIESPMLSKALDDDPARKAKVMNRIPFRKIGKPSDIGNAALFLASDAASYVTGVLLPVDGGAATHF